MSVVVTNFICSTMMSIMGLIVIKKILNYEKSILGIKSITLMLLLIILPITIHSVEYTYLYTLIVYSIMIVTYKYLFNISYQKSLIICGFIFAFLSILDLIIVGIMMIFFSLDEIRGNWYLNIISNIITSVISIGIFYIPVIKNKISYFIEKIENKKNIRTILFFILIMVAISAIFYTISLDCKLNSIFTTNFLIIIIVFLLVIILIREKDDYEKLSDEYDNLINYVKIFEDWIEKEQLNRHEYKNQLAAIRCMTKERKVKEKIDSIILDNINITNDTVKQLKPIPNGGLKGLLYYKISIAENKKIKIELDISIKNKKVVEKLTEEKLKTLCRLVGIYLDNAIEAAKETRKKIISIEIYETENEINMVFTNTFNNKKDISRRNEKGFSTKGKGHGKGLYFAKKIIERNIWLIQEQSIINKYYIQRLIIKK